MKKTHYIAMSGDHGYLPDHCEVYEDLDSAIDDLACLFAFGEKKYQELKRNRYLELGAKYAAEYCEIEECDCDDMSIHSDSK